MVTKNLCQASYPVVSEHLTQFFIVLLYTVQCKKRSPIEIIFFSRNSFLKCTSKFLRSLGLVLIDVRHSTNKPRHILELICNPYFRGISYVQMYNCSVTVVWSSSSALYCLYLSVCDLSFWSYIKTLSAYSLFFLFPRIFFFC